MNMYKEENKIDLFTNEDDEEDSVIAKENNDMEKPKQKYQLPDTRPLITKLFGDGTRFIRRLELAVVYDRKT